MSHEYWFHFTRQGRYFAAIDEVRERYEAPLARRTLGAQDPRRNDHGTPFKRLDAADSMNPLGKLPGSVWTIPPEPLTIPAPLWHNTDDHPPLKGGGPMTPFLDRDGIRLWHADARRVSEFIPEASVDCLITSPPYYELRSYGDTMRTVHPDGTVEERVEHYHGQIGSEDTSEEFLDNLIACTADWVKVLKPTGSMFINLGDKMKNKCLLGLPWRYALRCIDELGLILRAEIIWSKPNGLPESVTDRVRRSHEQWFHLTRQGRYYAAIDEVREPHAAHTLYCAEWEKDKHAGEYVRDRHNAARVDGGNRVGPGPNPLGKLPGSVWSIPSEPLQVPAHLGVDHFAAFPTEWPRRLILGWSPNGICQECNEGRRPVVAKDYDAEGRTTNGPQSIAQRHESPGREVRMVERATITGYACACPTPDAPTRHAVILDPFGGTGTTALVARALGRHAHHVDLSHDYLRLAEWRIWHDTNAHRKASERSGIPVPQPPAVDGQMSLLDGAA